MTILLAVALASPLPSAADPYGPAGGSVVSGMVRAAQFGEPGADGAIIAWLTSHPDAAERDRQQLEHRLCSDFEVRSAHAAAAKACAAAVALGADDRQDAANSAALAAVPPMRAIGSTRVPLTPNALGSRDALVAARGVSAPWIVDTGAEISVVSQSLAGRMGVRVLAAAIDAGSTTGDVHGSLGVIDLLRVGDAAIENVPVLVLPDSQLKIGGLPQIQGILGLPVLVAFRRAAWLDGGRMLALGEQAPVAPDASPRPYWHEEGLGIPVSTSRGILGAHLDTGANASFLRRPAHALLDPATEASAREHRGKMGGAGGVVDTREMVYPRLQLAVAGVPVTLADISIDETSDSGAARLGDDLVRQLARLVLDFEHMKVFAEPLPHRVDRGSLPPAR